MPFAAQHAEDVLHVIGSTFLEHGMVFDLPGYDSDLLDIPRHYLAAGGAFVVLVDAGRVVGTAGGIPRPDGVYEIKRVYLLPGYRGRGHGRALVEHIMARAVEAAAREVIAWSDVRLGVAHQVYERLGFQRFGERITDDIEHSREYGFRKIVRSG